MLKMRMNTVSGWFLFPKCRDFLLHLDARDAQQFLQKRLFGIPFPREQRREAKEKYEER